MPTLLLFGATGDLSQRMLLPSLFGLEADGLLPPDMRIIGTALSSMNDEEFRALTSDALERTVESTRLDPATLQRFSGRLEYVDVDAREESGRSEEHTSELQSLMRISYAVFCLKKKNINNITSYI